MLLVKSSVYSEAPVVVPCREGGQSLLGDTACVGVQLILAGKAGRYMCGILIPFLP